VITRHVGSSLDRLSDSTSELVLLWLAMPVKVFFIEAAARANVAFLRFEK
jgi:hypothetical protein